MDGGKARSPPPCEDRRRSPSKTRIGCNRSCPESTFRVSELPLLSVILRESPTYISRVRLHPLPSDNFLYSLNIEIHVREPLAEPESSSPEVEFAPASGTGLERRSEKSTKRAATRPPAERKIHGSSRSPDLKSMREAPGTLHARSRPGRRRHPESTESGEDGGPRAPVERLEPDALTRSEASGMADSRSGGASRVAGSRCAPVVWR